MALEVTVRIKIAATRDRVFDAWVDPEQMCGYFISRASDRMEPGKTVTWSWEDVDAACEVEVLAVESPRSLSFRWAANGRSSRVDVTFEDADGDTQVVVQEGSWDADDAGIARFGEQTQGWMHMLTCLKAYLEYGGINLREGASGTHAISVESTMRATPEQVFHAWTQQWASWFGVDTEAVMRPEVGVPFWFCPVHEGKRYPHFGRYLRLEPNRLVEHTWANEPTRGFETVVKLELSADGEGTRVRLTHSGFGDLALARGHEKNWPVALEHLDAWIAEQSD